MKITGSHNNKIGQICKTHEDNTTDRIFNQETTQLRPNSKTTRRRKNGQNLTTDDKTQTRTENLRQ